MADSAPRESNTNATIVLQFQVRKARVRGERSDGTVYLRETYQLVANVGLGRRKADRVAAMLNQLRIPVARRELSQRRASQQVAAAAPDQAEGPRCDECGHTATAHSRPVPLGDGWHGIQMGPCEIEACACRAFASPQTWDPSHREIL